MPNTLGVGMIALENYILEQQENIVNIPQHIEIGAMHAQCPQNDPRRQCEINIWEQQVNIPPTYRCYACPIP